jgi:ring-1,2-phenylacetyl-CoA epoxidase subunit PaaC
MQAAVDAVWPLLGELDQAGECSAVWDQVLAAATLTRPADVVYTGPYGRDGDHTPALAELLAELQGLARSLPGGVW